MKKKTPFNCTQQELYLAADIAWDLCSKNLLRFTQHKGFYTEGFLEARRGEVATARAIPNHKTRQDVATMHRANLDASVDECCYCFIRLSSFIASAFDEGSVKSKLDGAGSPFFEKAQSGNSGAMADLNQGGLNFIRNNEAALKANNNMPDTFEAEYKAVVADYQVKLANQKSGSDKADTMTKDNTEANNLVYKNLLTMFADAKVVFWKDLEMRNQFTFAAVLAQVVTQSVAGIRGKVTLENAKKPYPTVKITIEGTDKAVETNNASRFDIAQLASGKYNIIFSCTGYKDVYVEDFEVKTGVYNTLNVTMEALPGAVVAAA